MLQVVGQLAAPVSRPNGIHASHVRQGMISCSAALPHAPMIQSALLQGTLLSIALLLTRASRHRPSDRLTSQHVKLMVVITYLLSSDHRQLACVSRCVLLLAVRVLSLVLLHHLSDLIK